MQEATTNTTTLAIGIDLGDRHSHYCVLDIGGSVIDEGRLATNPAALRARFARQTAARIAIEVGTHSAWVSELLKEAGHDVLVANPRKLRMIFESDTKNDRSDARHLARVARMDANLLYPMTAGQCVARARRAAARASRSRSVCTAALPPLV